MYEDPFGCQVISLAIGLVIGLERGWQARAAAEGERAAGLRTHPLWVCWAELWAR
jgi:uncharacterized membrane protein YhiD involved in acid resistance